MIVLSPIRMLPEGLEAGAIRPDLWTGLRAEEILSLPMRLGRHGYALGDLFVVEGEGSDQIVLDGDMSALTGLGSGMTGGRLIVHGDVGARAGAEMRGGEMIVQGHAGACAGLGMRGGVLRISGNAGPRAGGAWPGETVGMRGGRLVIEGSASEGLGERMRRGVIVCRGNTGVAAASGMRGGTIIVSGSLGPYYGAGMHRGTIICLGGEVSLWPAFRYSCLYDPVIVRLYLDALSLSPPSDEGTGAYRRYHGDMTALGKGELLLWQPGQ